MRANITAGIGSKPIRSNRLAVLRKLIGGAYAGYAEISMTVSTASGSGPEKRHNIQNCTP
jgi:hypothetical protein